jgi:DNA-binding NarL/FixJ family response regulator
MRVVLVDDAAVVRAALADVLTAAGLDVAGQAGSVAAALALVGRAAPDVAVLDVSLSEARPDSGLVVAEHLARTHPAVGLLVYTGYDDDTYVERLLALRDGSRGYALKGGADAVPRLLEAIRSVGSGGTYLDPGLRRPPSDRSPRRARADADTLAGLSKQERQVLDVLAAWALAGGSASDDDVARVLGAGTGAVRRRLRAVLERLDLHAPAGSPADGDARILAGLLHLAHPVVRGG